ncbi:MAG: sucrose-6-phosphate hydrolase [Zymomonas mobilis]
MESLSYENLAKAEATQKKAGDQLLSSEWYPGFHVAPLTGWMNDPNGVIFFKGEYHLFYQYYPFAPVWGPMHWGHAKSTDLVHWETLPVALAPGDSFDRDGCFSGCAVDNKGILTLIYTGHTVLSPDSPDAIREVQCMATSKDGIHLQKQGVVLDTPPAKEVCHFRDPRIWKENGHWFMVVGYRTDDENDQGIGQVALYQSENLKDWVFLKSLLGENPQSPLGERAFMWECPDFFPLGNQTILMFSPQGLKAKGYQNRNLFQNGSIIGDWQNTTFTPTAAFAELDHGHDFYAAQRLEAKDGRQILIAWFDMWENSKPSQRDRWAGCMTLPRELNLVGDRVLMTPVKELELLRQAEKSNGLMTLSDSEHPFMMESPLQEIELVIDLEKSNAYQAGIALRCNGKGQETLLYIDRSQNRIVLDRNRSGQNVKGIRSCPLPAASKIKLHIFLDRSSIEVFVGDEQQQGLYTISSRIFPDKDSLEGRLFAIEGYAVFDSFKRWSLQNANKAAFSAKTL